MWCVVSDWLGILPHSLTVSSLVSEFDLAILWRPFLDGGAHGSLNRTIHSCYYIDKNCVVESLNGLVFVLYNFDYTVVGQFLIFDGSYSSGSPLLFIHI